MDLKRNLDLVHEMVEISLETVKSFGEAQIIHGGVKTIYVYELLATLISNPMVEEFSFSYLEELIRHLKYLGSTILLHICQDTTRLLNRMVEIGADILSLDVEVDLAQAKEIVRDRACILDNVGISTLALKGPDEVYNESCECISKTATGGKFILSSACEVPIDTQPENVDAMVLAAREYSPKFLSQERPDLLDESL